MRVRSTLCFLAATAVVTSAALAEYDVSPKIEGGVIKTNAFFDAEEVEVGNVAVFGYNFGEEVLLPPNELPDPGFHPLPGSGFAEGSQIGIQTLSVLQYWNGVGPISFAPAASGTTLSYAFGSSAASVDGTTIPANDVLVGPVDEFGEFDDHLDTEITLAAASGIYMVAARLNTTTPGITPSDSIFILFNYGLEEDVLEDAVVFARDTFAPGTVIPVVPEPAALGLLAAALPMALRRRR
ncbi:MAG TPA: hypothetical protein PLD59_14780 [Tepidisphaeraceae bacterium]|mgnify:CR=1 FL=1|nr:hypothetical protein [Tepidisphaeraceae bacterium]